MRYSNVKGLNLPWYIRYVPFQQVQPLLITSCTRQHLLDNVPKLDFLYKSIKDERSSVSYAFVKYLELQGNIMSAYVLYKYE